MHLRDNQGLPICVTPVIDSISYSLDVSFNRFFLVIKEERSYFGENISYMPYIMCSQFLRSI